MSRISAIPRPAGIQVKVGPKGYIHGWIYVGVPVYGEHVHHATLGPGVVTHVTDHHVHVQFHRTGEERIIPVVHDPEHVRRLESMSDDDIYKHLMSRGEGHHFDLGVAELDRRDRVDNESKIHALYDEAPTKPEDRERVYRGLTDLGENPEDAYNHAYGLRTDEQRRKAVTAQLREQGYGTGIRRDGTTYQARGFEEHARLAWNDDVQRRALDAENETNGFLTNPAGRAKGIDGWDLFTGPESTARKYASPELKEYWDKHGRPTFDDFTHQLLYGHGRRRRQDDFLT
ncbi:MAG TPA: hypothetical protein VGG54_22875 [Trebonia sp.]